MALISIIVPIYNVEKYLEECINSILAQTYKELELILVDDGSTDHSGEICDKYASLDNRIRVFHQKNQGVSVARNNGLAFVHGEYMTFVDSDDYIAPDMVELLYNNMRAENAQISICGAWFAYRKRIKERQIRDVYLKMSPPEALGKMLDFGYYDLSLWAKLYKTDLFQGFQFPPGIICEDMYVIPKVIAEADCVVYDSTPKYYYRQWQGSITKGKPFVVSYLDGLKACTEFVTKRYPDLSETIQCMDLFAHLMIYTALLRQKNENLLLLDEIYQKIIAKAMAMERVADIKKIPTKSRISLRLLLHSRKIHTAVYRAYWSFCLKLRQSITKK